MSAMDVLDLVGPTWELLPLRMPGGWSVRHNGLTARFEYRRNRTVSPRLTVISDGK